MQTNQLILKTNDMNQFKRAQVVILPSDLEQLPSQINTQNQHLYFISNDEIKKDDWCLNISKNIIYQKDKLPMDIMWKKIIATTDTSLTIDTKIFGKDRYKKLPQPSQQFIEKYIKSYNKGEVITDVLVEYELENINIHRFEDELKVNPKDNTITIKKLKDSWNRNEVIELINKHTFEFNGLNKSYSELNKWIEENL